jgi:ATP:ADP antiporter, AAA family
VTWKSKLKQQYPNPNDYTAFMGNFSTVTGMTTFTLMLVARYIFEKKTWGFAAVITPLVLGGTGLLFFSLILFGGSIEPLLSSWSVTPLFAGARALCLALRRTGAQASFH